MKNLKTAVLAVGVIQAMYVLPAWSTETVGEHAMGSYSLEALKVVFSLGLVLLVFYLGVTVFKKYLGASFKANSSIKILGGLSLGGKEKVVLIEAGGVNLLLGVSSANVTTLHHFKEHELSLNEEEDSKLLNFNSHLERLIGKK